MKTKSILFVFPLMLALVLTAKGQLLSAGGTVELSTASVKITDVPNQTVNLIQGNGIIGIGIGGYAKVKLGPVFIKPGLLFVYQGGTVMAQSADGNNSNVSFNSGKIEVPVLFGINILGPVYINGGPVFNQLLFVTSNYNGSNVNVEKSGLGYRIGAGVNISRVSLDIDYEGLRTSPSGSLSSYQLPDEIVLDLGIRLVNTKK